jgi:hypothetical protein
MNGRCVNHSKCYCYKGFSGKFCQNKGGEGGFFDSNGNQIGDSVDGNKLSY